MAAIDDILIPSLTLEEIASDGSTLTNPAADHRRLFLGEDASLHLIDSAGTVTDIGSGGGGIDSGTSFPGSPSTNDLFYRTDEARLYFYNGTRWLTTQQFREPIGGPQGISASADVGILAPWTTTDMWLETLWSSTLVNGTSDGSNFWTCELRHRTTANASSGIVNFTTATNTTVNWHKRGTAIGALFDPTTYGVLFLNAAKTSAAGSLFAGFSLEYRLVGT